jgi:hypothetical protein
MISDNAEFEAKIVDAIYRGACDGAELSRAVAMIAGYFGSPGTTLAVVGGASGADAELLISCGVLGPSELRRYQEYAHVDPIPPIFVKMTPGKMTTSNHVIPNDGKGVFRNEFLAPLGVDENLGGPLFRTHGRCAAISVLKGINQAEFGDGHVERLSRLAPHLTRALQIRRLFLQGQESNSALESIVERNETGMIALHSDGTALFVNAAARAIAAACDGIGLDRNGRLIAVDRRAAMRLASLQGDVVRGGAGGFAAVPRPSGHPPYAVLVSSLPVRDDQFAPGVLFAIHDPLRRPVATAQRIAQLLHVPSGAAKVVQALLDGLNLKEYSDRTGLSINTVRSHLKIAFARTETRSQAELIRMALSALNDLGPYFPERKRQ